MRKEEVRRYIMDLEKKVEFNKRIRCYRVAAKFQRMIDEYKKILSSI